MTVTVNKGYELQATGSNTGTWGVVNNNSVIQIIDTNMGGIVSKVLSNVDVTLSSDEAQNCIIRLTGVLTGAVQVTNSAIGFYFVENLTTGNFTVTLTNGAGTPVIIPQSSRVTVIADATNGCRVAGSFIQSGTAMLFVQSSAPLGWTKSSTHNNKALRIVSGTASTGGSLDFTTAFSNSRTISQANLPNVNFTLSINGVGDHTHGPGGGTDFINAVASGGFRDFPPAGSFLTAFSATGPAGAHTHTGTAASGGSGTGLDFSVAYVDVIMAIKD